MSRLLRHRVNLPMPDDTNIAHLSHRCNDATLWSVEQMLTDALSGVREKRRTPTKAIVLFLDDAQGKYDVGFCPAGLSLSQAVSLVEAAKAVFLREMGY